ncbi:MAG: homoserine O-acetyltransferase, partial [Alphaproteobacteria bacterium]
MSIVSNSGAPKTGSIAVEPAVTDLPGHTIVLGETVPLELVSGQHLGPFTVAYQTYGSLNGDKSNAVLICHALTGDQYAAETHPITGKPGWWGTVIGSGLPIDTDRYFVICINVLGGCMGTAGPKDINPQTGKRFGLDFPLITITDMVAAQKTGDR